MNESPKPQDKKVAKQGDFEVQFTPFGATDKIKLSMAIVKDFVAVPTKNGCQPSPRDCLKFIMLCRGKKANPFEGDCYMIGYDGKDGPAFSIVCGIELFLKRAGNDQNYDGSESGVIVENENGIKERPGAVVYESETLLGGWAKVYQKNHSRPVYKTVKFSTYNTGRSRWEKDPGGMIAKVALSQALREAYPTALGGLYTQEEMQKVTEAGDGMVVTREPIQMPQEIPAKGAEKKPDAQPEPAEPQPAVIQEDQYRNSLILKVAEVIEPENDKPLTSWAFGTGKIKAGQKWQDLPTETLETLSKLNKKVITNMISKHIDNQPELPLGRQPGEEG